MTTESTDRDYSRLTSTVFGQDRVRRLRAVVVGAGALGNEVLKNLALLGIGQITVVDRDSIEPSNLTRSILFCSADVRQHLTASTAKAIFAAARLREINPDVTVDTIVGEVADVGLGVFRDADVVFSCVDNEMARLETSWACWRVDRPLIDGGLGHFNYSSGQVSIFPGCEGPCYLCRKPEQRRRELLQELHGREDPCWLKARVAEQDAIIATTPIMASVVGAMQIEAGLRFNASGAERTSGIAHRITLHPKPALETSTFALSPTCPLHDPQSIVADPIALGQSVETCTADAVIAASGISDAIIRLDWPVTSRATCHRCHHSWHPMVRRAAFRQLACPACGARELVETEVVTSIAGGTELAQRSLAWLGQHRRPIYEVVSSDLTRCAHVTFADSSGA